MTEKLTQEIERIYEINNVGGPLHIVLDDGNVEDHFIAWAVGQMKDHWSVVDHPDTAEELLALSESVAGELMELSVEERERLYEDDDWGMGL